MTVALWYSSYYQINVDLFDSEQDAASEAVNMEDQEYGIPAGIQYEGGVFVPRGEWAAYDVEEKRRSEQYRKDAEKWDLLPKPALKKISPPFECRGKTAEVDEDSPAWLGMQGATS